MRKNWLRGESSRRRNKRVFGKLGPRESLRELLGDGDRSMAHLCRISPTQKKSGAKLKVSIGSTWVPLININSIKKKL